MVSRAKALFFDLQGFAVEWLARTSELPLPAPLGLAHIGVLQWFEDHHIPIDYLARTSNRLLLPRLFPSDRWGKTRLSPISTWNIVIRPVLDSYPKISVRSAVNRDLAGIWNRIQEQ